MTPKELEKVLKNVISWLATGFIISFGIIIIIMILNDDFKRNTTDFPFPDKRSNMELHIDALTGCHYLSSKNGGLTPRLSSNGNHICLK